MPPTPSKETAEQIALLDSILLTGIQEAIEEAIECVLSLTSTREREIAVVKLQEAGLWLAAH